MENPVHWHSTDRVEVRFRASKGEQKRLEETLLPQRMIQLGYLERGTEQDREELEVLVEILRLGLYPELGLDGRLATYASGQNWRTPTRAQATEAHIINVDVCGPRTYGVRDTLRPPPPRGGRGLRQPVCRRWPPSEMGPRKTLPLY